MRKETSWRESEGVSVCVREREWEREREGRQVPTILWPSLVGFRSSWMAKGNPMWSSVLRMWPLPLCPSAAATGWQEQSNGAAWVSPVLPSSPADFRFPNFAAEFTGVRKTSILSSQTEESSLQEIARRSQRSHEREREEKEETKGVNTHEGRRLSGARTKSARTEKKRWQEPHHLLAVTPPNRWQRLPGKKNIIFGFFFFFLRTIRTTFIHSQNTRSVFFSIILGKRKRTTFIHRQNTRPGLCIWLAIE